MLDEMFAPFEGITGVMAGAVKEFAEVHIEVQQEGFHAVHVGERNSQVTAILFSPHFEGVFLRIPKSRT